MNPSKSIPTPSVAQPCEVCERLRTDQVRMTKRGTVYIALVCNECHAMTAEIEKMVGPPWGRVYRLVPQH